jgi:chromosome segregation ATPase
MKRLAILAVLFGCGCGSTFFEEGLSAEEREAKITGMRDELEQKKSELKSAEAEVQKCATEREEVRKNIDAMEDTDSEEGIAKYNELANRHAELEQAEYEAEEKVYVLQDEVEELEYNLDGATQEHTARLEEEAYEAKIAKAEEDAGKAEEDAAKAEAEAAKKAEEEAAKKAEEEAAKKAEEEAAKKAAADAAAAKKAIDDEVMKGNALTMEGLGLFSKITGKMGSLPDDQGELKALQAENQGATDKLNEAKTTFTGVRGKVDDPSKIDAKISQIDKLLALLKGYDDRIKAKLN